MGKKGRLQSAERGQATTEYILLIAVVVAAVLAVGMSLREGMQRLVEGRLKEKIYKMYFDPDAMHRFRILR